LSPVQVPGTGSAVPIAGKKAGKKAGEEASEEAGERIAGKDLAG
jgi:hypothetical protein